MQLLLQYISRLIVIFSNISSHLLPEYYTQNFVCMMGTFKTIVRVNILMISLLRDVTSFPRAHSNPIMWHVRIQKLKLKIRKWAKYLIACIISQFSKARNTYKHTIQSDLLTTIRAFPYINCTCTLKRINFITILLINWKGKNSGYKCIIVKLNKYCIPDNADMYIT